MKYYKWKMVSGIQEIAQVDGWLVLSTGYAVEHDTGPLPTRLPTSFSPNHLSEGDPIQLFSGY